MFRGFMNLYSIIDVYSRKIVGLDVSNRSRCYIERFSRTIKYEHIYMHPVNGGIELLKRIRKYILIFTTMREGMIH
jgi:putative transposase